jgi:hypothetical protein
LVTSHARIRRALVEIGGAEIEFGLALLPKSKRKALLSHAPDGAAAKPGLTPPPEILEVRRWRALVPPS